MILVDTSVVIDYLRTGDPQLLALFQSNSGAICGVTRAEILNGARSPAHRQHLIAALDTFTQVPVLEPQWDQLGDNLLRAAGVTVPFADAIIATVAIDNGLSLWTRDAQFRHVRNVLSRLALFQEPP